MRPLVVVLAVACLAIVCIALFVVRPASRTPQRVRFTGFTNGVVGAITPTFASLTTNNAAGIQRWLTAGTNGAVFAITNQQSSAIWVFPLGRMCTDEAVPMRDETPLLNAPTFSGIRLLPGQAADIQVAVLPHSAPW